MNATAVADEIPLGLYLHFPWCVSKCPYCDFNSHALRGELPHETYLAALCADLEQQCSAWQSQLAGRTVTTIFMGGGTPSLFPPAAIDRLLHTVRRLLSVSSAAEITLEANPGTIEHGRFAEYAAAGVNRISLGAQSFDAQMLHKLGRVHSPADTRRAVEELRTAGLDNFNLDLMYGLPGQDLHGALRDLQQALQLEPAQLSHYQLTLEPGTVFAATPPPGLPADEATSEILEHCMQRLAEAGFERYEVSAYARAGRRCAHNLLYWQFGDYLGIGAGAHGKLSGRDADSGQLRIHRSVQQRDPRRYQRDPAAGLGWQAVAPRELPFEFMLNSLRLVEGFTVQQFETRTGLPWQAVADIVQRQSERGLLEPLVSAGVNAGVSAGESAGGATAGWRPSPQGLRFLNDLLVEFLPDRTGT